MCEVISKTTSKLETNNNDFKCSSQQIQHLTELKELTKDVDQKIFNEGALRRYLRARNYDVKKAHGMIRDTIVWRAENEIEELFPTLQPIDDIVCGYDLYHCGHDAEGRPVYYAPLGEWASARDLFERGLEQDCLNFAGKSMEMVFRELLNTRHQQFVCIVDNSGVSFKKIFYESRNWAGIQALMRLFRDYEANYPETLNKAFLINTPSIFYWGYNIVKPLMTSQTLSKIQIFDTNADVWLPALEEHLPRSVIPEVIGGNGHPIGFYPQYHTKPDSDPLLYTFCPPK